MDDATILDGIREIARRELGYRGELEGRMRLAEDLELDSIKTLTLAVEVENRFRICLDPDSEAQIVTIRDLVAAVRREIERRPDDAE